MFALVGFPWRRGSRGCRFVTVGIGGQPARAGAFSLQTGAKPTENVVCVGPATYGRDGGLSVSAIPGEGLTAGPSLAVDTCWQTLTTRLPGPLRRRRTLGHVSVVGRGNLGHFKVVPPATTLLTILAPSTWPEGTSRGTATRRHYLRMSQREGHSALGTEVLGLVT